MKLKRYSTITIEQRHLKCFYYLEFSILVPLIYLPSIPLRLLFLKNQSPFYDCVDVSRFSLNEILTVVAHTQFLQLLSHFSSRFQLLYTILLGLLYNFFFQKWLRKYYLTEIYLNMYYKLKNDSDEVLCKGLSRIEEIGYSPQLFIITLAMISFLANALPLVKSLSTLKNFAKRKSYPDESSPLLQVPNKKDVVLWGQSLHKQYKGNAVDVAIQNASIYALRGKVVALIGQNGAGKTTLLKILHQNMPPDSGSLFHSKRQEDVRTALINSNSKPPSFCSLAHYAKLMSCYYHLSPVLRQKFSSIIDELKINQASRIIKTLKYALSICPDVLLLDQTLTPETRGLLTQFLKSQSLIKKSQFATIIATHDLEWAIQHSDYLCMLEKGRIISFTETKALASVLRNSFNISLIPQTGSDLSRIAYLLDQKLNNLKVTQSSHLLTLKGQIRHDTIDLLEEIEGLSKIEKFDVIFSKGDPLTLSTAASHTQSNQILSQNLLASLLNSKSNKTWCTKFKALLELQLSLAYKYLLVIILCSVYFMDTLPIIKQQKFHHFTQIARYHLDKSNILFISIYNIQWIWYQRQMKVTELSSAHILSTSVVFSLCFLSYLPPLASSLPHEFIFQLGCYFFTVFQLTLWFAIYSTFASRTKYTRILFLAGFLLVVFVKLEERLFVWKEYQFVKFTKISPFVNLAYAPLHYLLKINFFIGQQNDYTVGLILLLVYIFLINCLLITCCWNKKRRMESEASFIHINGGCRSLQKTDNFVMTQEYARLYETGKINQNLLLPSFTPLECLLFAPKYKGIEMKCSMRQIQLLLEFFGLSRNRHKKMREMSLGEQKKVMIAMELIGSPNQLYFRNLFQNLDYVTQKKLELLLLAIHRSLKVFSEKKMQISISERNFSPEFTIELHQPEISFQRPKITTELKIIFKVSTEDRFKEEIAEYLILGEKAEVDRCSKHIWKILFTESSESMSSLLNRVQDVEQGLKQHECSKVFTVEIRQNFTHNY